MQLVFGRHTLSNVQFKADWNLIEKHKQQKINKNDKRQNSKCLVHEHQVGDKVLVQNTCKAKCEDGLCVGPHETTAVNNDRTVHHKKGAVIDKMNTRQIKPHFTWEQPFSKRQEWNEHTRKKQLD